MTEPTPTRARPIESKRGKADVTPSAPGSVEAWLDMLVSMLALPRHERERVRDELEDHLRSRIDDLIITGLTEPEALQKAASELGETADLARQISHAHGSNRKRTYAMHAALIALAGSITAVGISLSGGGSNPNTVNGIPVVSDVPVVGMAVAGEQPDQQESRVNLRDTTLEAVIKAATGFADRPVLVHWDVLAGSGIERDHPIDFDVDPLPHHLVHDLLTEHFEREIPGDTLAAYTSDDLYEISTRSHFDQRSTERVLYPIADLLSSIGDSMGSDVQRTPASNITNRLADVVQSHIEPDAWIDRGGGLASLSILDQSLIVTAPERVHEEIASFLEEMRGEMRRRARELDQRNRDLARTLGAEHEMLKRKFEAIEQSMAQADIKTQAMGFVQATTTPEELSERAELAAEHQRLRRESAEIESRIRYLRTRLIAAEYEPQMGSSALPDVSNALRVQGVGDQPLSIPADAEGMSLRELVRSVSRGPVQSRSSWRVFRRDSFLVSVDAADIDGEGGQVELLPGDRVVLSTFSAPSSRNIRSSGR